MEVERDNATALLREVAEAADEADFEDVMSKVKAFVEEDPFTSSDF